MTKTKKKIGIGYYLKKHKFAVAVYILTVLLASAFSTTITILMANAISYITTGAYETGLRLIIYAGIATVFTRFSWWINSVVYFKYSNIMWKEIAKDLTKRSFELSTSTFSDNNSGSFVQRIMNDPNEVIGKLSSVVDMLGEIITGFVVVIYIISLNWIIGLLYAAMLILCFIIEIYRRKVGRKNKLKTKKINDSTYSLVNEIVKSEKDIKALGLEEKLHESSNESFDVYQKQRYKADLVDMYFYSSRNLILEVFGIFILVLGITMIQREILTLAAYILLYSYKGSLYAFVWQVGQVFKTVTEISVSNQRMFGLYDESVYSIEKFGSKVLKSIKGKITFKDVEYAYTEVKEKTNENKKSKKQVVPEKIKKEPIFKNLSFVIEPNTTVAFVGKSGSGKSTILSLIAKLIDADKGEVKIDGANIKELSKKSLRDNISLINQFPYIFDMTIKENLLLVKKDATDDEIWSALEKASFSEDVKAMPKGIDTKVGESGIKLSGGNVNVWLLRERY